MPGILEVVTFTVGTSTAKWVWKLWAGNGLSGQVGDDLTELIKSRILGRLDAKRTIRQFEDLAESVARRLAPLLQHEFADLDAGEQAAALEACVATIEASRVDLPGLLALDMHAPGLEDRVRGQDPRRVELAGLGEAGAALYDLLLAESCKSVVAVMKELPEFGGAIAVESLQRQSELSNLMQQVMQDLPTPRVPRGWGPGSEDTRFEIRYLDRLADRLDELQLFGVDLPATRRRYSLSVAYISLSASLQEERRRPRPTTQAASASAQRAVVGVEEEADVVRVEAALAGSSNVIVSGLAGSGKTTLLQWLAVAAARSNFTAELAEWNDYVPFFLQLRRYINGALPRPEDFLQPVVPNLHGVLPAGWVHRVLDSGRALLLIDGLDELTAEKGEEARTWLSALLTDFPAVRVVLTSRPEAITEHWSDGSSFRIAELLPMQLHDIRAFVSHWHTAARDAAARQARQMGQSPRAAESALASAENNLLNIISENAVVRSLASTPLLCALVCALHKGREHHVPDSRMELYDAALRMLLISRDEERDVVVGTGLGLTYTSRLLLLQEFAAWLHENDWTDVDEDSYLRRIAAEVPHLTRVSGDGVAVAKLLLDRSGVLSRPVEGRVGFVHKTFQEYLAARSLVQDESLRKLVLHGHLEQWREVVIMAAGHATPKQGEQLIAGLVDQGERDAANRHRLFLLAVACLETSPKLDPGLVQRLDECLAEVMPPKNMAEAAAVAAAGSLAVAGLKSSHTRATEAAASVRGLALIGSEDALAALEAFSSDPRVTVARQLIREWDRFDAAEYARRVLADNMLDHGSLVLSDATLLAHTRYLKHLEGVFIDGPGRIYPLSEVAQYDKVFGLDASFRDDIENLRELAPLPLSAVWMRRCRNLESLQGLTAKPGYRANLNFEGCAALTDIGALAGFAQMNSLNLSETAVRTLAPLSDVTGIHDLRLRYVSKLQDLGSALPVTNLQVTSAPLLRDLTGFERSATVRTASFRDLDPAVSRLSLPASLRSFTLTGAPALAPGVSLTGGEDLLSLTINYPGETVSLLGLPSFRSLQYLGLGRVSGLVDLQALLECPNLRRVRCSFANAGRSEDPLLEILPTWDRKATTHTIDYLKRTV